MRFLPLFTLGVCASTALAQPDQTPTTIAQPELAPPAPGEAPRPAEPKAQIELDLRALLNTLNRTGGDNIQNVWNIGQYLSESRIGFFGGSEWIEYFATRRSGSQYRFDGVEFERLEGDTARVKIAYTLIFKAPALQIEGEAPKPEQITEQKESETLELKRERVSWTRQEKWRLAVPARADVVGFKTLSLGNIAYFGGQRAGTLEPLRGEIAASRLKQCALGVLQFVQDYDEIFRFENEFWREAIRPYVKNDSLFGIPGTARFFTFNDNLSDKSLAAINEAAQTVLFYEGQDEEPEFRYDGRAVICFTDGHVELVTREKAANLRWKP